MMAEIEKLLPHREPFIFVDYITEATVDEIIGIKTFSESDFWLKEGYKSTSSNIVPGPILLESMAQCGGAGVRFLGLTSGLFGLASIEYARFPKQAKFHKEIKHIIKNIRISDKLVKQSGIGYMENEVVVEASWLCIKIE